MTVGMLKRILEQHDENWRILGLLNNAQWMELEKIERDRIYKTDEEFLLLEFGLKEDLQMNNLLTDLMNVCADHNVKLTAGIWNAQSVILISQKGNLLGVVEMLDAKRAEGVKWLPQQG